MEKIIPYEKLSKKEKRKIGQARRQTWGELNPVTRKPANSKAYNRKRTQDWKKDFQTCAHFISPKGTAGLTFGAELLQYNCKLDTANKQKGASL